MRRSANRAPVGHRRHDADLAGRLLPYPGPRSLDQRDVPWNDARPETRMDTQTFEVFADGELATSAPAERRALAAAYFAR